MDVCCNKRGYVDKYRGCSYGRYTGMHVHGTWVVYSYPGSVVRLQLMKVKWFDKIAIV